MLHQFSWHQFLCAAIIFTMAWYAVIIPIIFRKKIFEFLSGKTSPPEKLRREWEEEIEEEPDDQHHSLIGKLAEVEGISVVEMDTIGFIPNDDDGNDPYLETEDQKINQLGLISDILQELKIIFQIMKDENGTKEDFMSLFKLISSRYPKIRLVPEKTSLNDFITENLPFVISEEELNEIWL